MINLKSRTIVIKRKYLLLILITIVLFIFFLYIKNNFEKKEEIVENNILKTNVIEKTLLPVSKSNYKKKEAYVSIPQNIDRI